jgi:hypothetical protein
MRYSKQRKKNHEQSWRWIIGIIVSAILIRLLLVGAQISGLGSQEPSINRSRCHGGRCQGLPVAIDTRSTADCRPNSKQIIKQDIEEIGNRLKAAAEARGEAAIAQLDQSIEQYNTTLQTVEDASREASDPEVKATLDQIYNVLLASKDQLTQFVLSTQQ